MSPLRQNHIILLGYMGAGKTTVGEILAARHERLFIDLDVYIEMKENDSITQIIEEKGIIYFRKKEREYLKEVLAMDKKMILSLGGGTPCYYDNMDLINKSPNDMTVYLRANVPFLTNRIFDVKDHRPLISRFDSKSDLAEFIGKHLLERSAFYDQAQHIISIEDKTPDEIAKEIEELV